MKKLIIGISVLIIIVLGILFFLKTLENQEYRKRGSLLIEKIEEYKLEYDQLPESVKDLETEPEMGEGPYYEKVDSLKYIVYFNIGFDNTLIYYSDTKEWR